ncbi:hypothetical protein [Brevundimonas sp.]|uniref:hypothetical protein n=1 Tax=Brevundimonas sp. TaxID=1871086 RepID=UPI002EDB9A72
MKYESMRADQAFGPLGGRFDLPTERVDRSASALIEYGLTDRLTLQMKGEWQEGRDAYVDFDGRGPLEIGARWQAYRDNDKVVAVYAGYAQGGAGRNAGYAPPGAGDSDWEVRLLAGRSWLGSRAFVEGQAARRWRQGLPDEVRVDLTAGAHVNDNWMLMGQAFGGAADKAVDGSGARWLSLEATAVRHIGDWSVQAGWRHTVAGRDTPVAHGPIIGVWRRF